MISNVIEPGVHWNNWGSIGFHGLHLGWRLVCALVLSVKRELDKRGVAEFGKINWYLVVLR
jgi:hypothetical protein